MNAVRVACVVEGQGEVQAVPELVRRIALDLDPGLVPHVSPPVRVQRNRIAEQSAELQRGIEKAIRSVQLPAGVLILLDSDDDCPATLGPELLGRVLAARSDLPCAVVLAKREYEAWFLAAAESLAGKRGLPADLQPPPDPEGVRGAKEWLRDRMPRSRKYVETADQAALTAVFDFNLARQRSDSFDKCYREITRLLTALRVESEPSSEAETKSE